MMFKYLKKILMLIILFPVGFSLFLPSCERKDEIESPGPIFVFGGAIINPSYKPVENCSVTLITKNGTFAQKTDRWGNFEFRVPKGNYEIIFQHLLYEELKKQVTIDSANVWITYQFTNWKTHRISGEVSEKNGTPIPMALIFLKGMKNHVDTLIVSDQNGQFSSRVRSGEYSVHIYKFSYRDTLFTFRLESDTVITDLHLSVSPDYFPLCIGSWWEYDFSEIFSPSAGGYAYEDSGRQIIKILSQTYNAYLERRYEVELTFSGIRKYGIADWGMFQRIDSTKSIEYSYTFEAKDHLVDGIYFPIKLAEKYDWKVRYRHFIKESDEDIVAGDIFTIHQKQVQTLVLTGGGDWPPCGQYEKAVFAPEIGLVKTFKESGHHDCYLVSSKELIDFHIEK